MNVVSYEHRHRYRLILTVTENYSGVNLKENYTLNFLLDEHLNHTNGCRYATIHTRCQSIGRAH